MSLQVNPDLGVIIRAPKKLDDAKIREFIIDKRNWIEKKKEYYRKTLHLFKAKKAVTGEKLLYLGVYYPLVILEKKQKDLFTGSEFVLSEKQVTKAEKIFSRWYRKKAEQFFCSRVGARTKVSILTAKQRWGSCDGLGHLKFNWKLIMAPPEIIDYVIAHELAHLKVHNHKKGFWNEVKKMDPNFKEKRKWLKQYGHILNCEFE